MVQICVDRSKDYDYADDAIVAIIQEIGDKGLKCFTQISGFVNLLMKDQVAYAPLHDYPDGFNLLQENGVDKVEFFHTNTMLPAPRGVRDQFCKSRWIYGPSRMGTAHLARSLGRHW
jgi:hypothetical protein